MRRSGKNRYQNDRWIVEFGPKFSFTVASKKSKQEVGGAFYYTGEVKLITGSKRLPRPILNEVIELCKERCKEGLMPNN